MKSTLSAKSKLPELSHSSSDTMFKDTLGLLTLFGYTAVAVLLLALFWAK